METANKNICERVIDLAQSMGVQGCDVILNQSKSLSLKSQKLKIDELKVSSAQTVGVRIAHNERIGNSYSESFEEDALKLMVQSAIENAKNMKEDTYQKILGDPGEYIIKNNVPKDDLDKKIQMAIRLENDILTRESRVKTVPYSGLSETDSNYYYLNSNGIFHFENNFYYSGFTSALVEGNNTSSMHYHGGVARNLDDLNIDDYVSESIEHASNWLDAKPVKTGNYHMVFTPDSFESLKGVFGIMFSAKSAVEKMNPYKDQMGAIIADERLSIKDCPKYEKAFFKSHLDSEGFKQSDINLLIDGKLNSFYHNSKTAQELKMKNNFRGSRGARSGLSVSSTTQVWSASNGSDAEVSNGRYLEIHALQGLHSGANPISGEFSFGASGYLCEDGKRLQAVKGITVSGNFYQMLKKIKSLSSTIYHSSDQSFFAPKIKFLDMSVAGE